MLNVERMEEKKEEYWKGFEFACALLDETYVHTSSHPNNIADCLRAKVNRLPTAKVRKTEYKCRECEVRQKMPDSELCQPCTLAELP